MGFSVDLYDAPFYTGAGSTQVVPNVYPVAINGRPFMIDFAQPFYRQYKREVTQLLRSQADVGTIPGEQSINPEDLWRRSQDDWSLGAGQIYEDRKDSDYNRFRQSMGINVWTKWQMSLLNNTVLGQASAHTNLQAVNVGNRCYEADGAVLRYTLNPLTQTRAYITVIGTPAATISSISTDGWNVYITCGASGLYWTNAGSNEAYQLVTSALDPGAICKWTNGRLMLANLNSIYNIISTAPAILPTPLFTHSVPTFIWTCFAEGPTQIYAAGTSGNKSWIYGTTILTDGTALAAPVVKGQTPTGETITTMLGYLGYLVVGTTAGVRFATLDSAGTVTLASLIPTPNPVQCLDGYDRFVWYGLTNYDVTDTGLGRMDLQNFAVQGVEPAYATDLMATSYQGIVPCAKTWQGVKLFTVNGVGFFYEDATHKVPQGYLDTGWIQYDLADRKQAVMVDVQSPIPLPGGSYTAFLSADGGSFYTVGTHRVADPDPVSFDCSQVSGAKFEFRFQLNRDTANPALSPIINRYTFRVWPTPKRPLVWQLPLIINEDIVTTAQDTEGFAPLAQLQFLEQLCISGAVVSFQEGVYTYPCIIADVTFLPDAQTLRSSFYNGIALIQLKGILST